ncbi:DUF6495 family protein [uncultured Olleya sp.]|uniref:DUF6495 family protein n=1 Tax=uncultured Olleya sp. TaxID=757243 RepID=UPI00259A810D|nr:DUF6495 family protein [uncultured Olleya sp.]
MKYSRLTKEQFEELHQEFINFLATQSITAEEWATIKAKQPEVAEQELDVFSDLVWEGVLKSVKYVEQISAQNIHLFSFKEDHMHVIGIKIDGPIDVTTKDGFNWLRENLMDETVTFTQGKKDYSEDENLDKFKLIQSGSAITKGELYEYMNTLIN